MAKGSVSAPDPPAESEEESREEETSSEEGVNAAGSETESDSESEHESKQTDNALPIKKPPSTPVPGAKNSKQQTSDSSSEEEESEESESESASDTTIKPIVSRPVDGDAQRKPKSKPNTVSLSSLSKKPNSAAGAKRPATSEETGGDSEVKETKRSKKGNEESDKKSSLNTESRKNFRRTLWSEEDEIALLNGMADFSANGKADPFTNMDVFHEFIKKYIHVDASKAQLRDKIHKMRKKYLNNVDKEKQGQGKIFYHDHDQKAFELSKKVWGKETSFSAGRTTASPKINGDLVKRSSSKNVKSKMPVIDIGEECTAKGENVSDVSKGGLELERLKSVNFGAQKLGIEEWIMQNSIQLVDGERRAKMDEKWRRFRTEEAEIYCKKLELLLEEAKLLVDALRSSRD